MPSELVRAALERVVAEEDDRMRVAWDDLTELRQNVLRAVAWNGAGLTARDTLERFGLGHGGTARNSALALEKRGLLRKAESTVGYAFDSPFARAWVAGTRCRTRGCSCPSTIFEWHGWHEMPTPPLVGGARCPAPPLRLTLLA